MRRCYHPLAMKMGGASRSCKRQGSRCSPKTFQKGSQPCTHLDFSPVRPNLDFNIIHIYRFEPPCSCVSVTVTPEERNTPCFYFTPFQVRIHVMPGGKEIIVLKATRPTASCLSWRVRPEEGKKKAWQDTGV